MFKSKVFQYGAIALSVVATSGAIWANTNLKPQPKNLAEAQTPSEVKSGSLPNKDFDPNPEIESDILAQLPNRPNREKNPDLPSGRILNQLNLSPEQLQKIKEIRDRDSANIGDLIQRSRQTSKELRDLLATDTDKAVIRTKHEEMLSLQQNLRRQHFERTLAMREILTPQQRSQLSEIMKNNRSRMREGMRDRLKERFENRSST